MSDEAPEPALTETTNAKHTHRWKPGQSGNPAGRPKGARHIALQALDVIGQENAAEIMRAVVDAARGGDMRAADILLRRLWPERKGRPVPIALPVTDTAAGVMQALTHITAAVAEGEISADEAQAISSVLETQRRAIETQELEARIAALEASQKGKHW